MNETPPIVLTGPAWKAARDAAQEAANAIRRGWHRYVYDERPDMRPLSREEFEKGARVLLDAAQAEMNRIDIERAAQEGGAR